MGEREHLKALSKGWVLPSSLHLICLEGECLFVKDCLGVLETHTHLEK